jgi:hypothetical protein
VGFEPTVLSHTAFRERHLQPLGHLSARENTRAAERERQVSGRKAQVVETVGDSSTLGGRKARLVESRREPIG